MEKRIGFEGVNRDDDDLLQGRDEDPDTKHIPCTEEEADAFERGHFC